MEIPEEVESVLKTLQDAGFGAYIVGGCVRDILRGEKPKDWDVATAAKPQEIQNLFEDTFYENEFGTVGVKTGSEDETLAVVEVTTYRAEAKYSDKRHPDRVDFTNSLEQDLQRRDFTVNAMAMGFKSQITNHKSQKNSKLPPAGRQGKIQNSKFVLVDLFEGEKDLKQGVVRTVGDPKARFGEDALRLMRAVRFATVLNFTIEGETFEAIKQNAKLIENIAKERVRDELSKMIDSPFAHNGIILMKDSGLLQLVLPEVAKGIDVGQNKHHIYTVFEHNLYSLQWAAEHDYPFHVKLAALLHDVGKPQTKRGEGHDSTFYGHEVVGGRIAKKLLERLRFDKKTVEKVVRLVRYHLFYYNVNEVTEKSVRRLVAKVGPENMDDLVKVRICDRMGSGVPKPEPYRLRHFRFMVEKVQKDPISVGMLKVNGKDIMDELDIKPGPKVGSMLHILLDEVLDDPAKNEREHQLERIRELGKLSEKELKKLEKEAKAKQEEVEQEEVGEIKKKFHVK